MHSDGPPAHPGNQLYGLRVRRERPRRCESPSICSFHDRPLTSGKPIAVLSRVQVETPAFAQQGGAAPAAAAPPTTIQAALANDAAALADKFTGLARVMAGKYDWRPSPGVRSVADVFNLIVMENQMLAGLLSGAGAQGGGGMGGRGQSGDRSGPAPGGAPDLVRCLEAGAVRAVGQRPEDKRQIIRTRDHEAGGRPDAAVRPARASRPVDRLRAQQQRRAALEQVS
jgi:hypothetical protein